MLIEVRTSPSSPFNVYFYARRNPPHITELINVNPRPAPQYRFPLRLSSPPHRSQRPRFHSPNRLWRSDPHRHPLLPPLGIALRSTASLPPYLVIELLPPLSWPCIKSRPLRVSLHPLLLPRFYFPTPLTRSCYLQLCHPTLRSIQRELPVPQVGIWKDDREPTLPRWVPMYPLTQPPSFRQTTVKWASLPIRMIAAMNLQRALSSSEMTKFAPSRLIEVTHRTAIKVSLSVHMAMLFLANHSQPSLDRQSNCTSFDGLDSVQSPDHVAHCYTNTYMDHSAQVFNGDVARAYDPSSTREHHLHGGSIKNQSKLVNGDLDRDTFLAIFCNSNDGTRQEGGRREGTRHRRRGPRAEGRAGPQPRV